MNKLVPLALLAVATTLCVSAQQQQSQTQSLGDVARTQKSADKTRKVWTNDDFPDRPTSAEPSAGDAAAGDASADTAATGPTDASGKPVAQPAAEADKAAAKKEKVNDADAQKKLDDEWKSKLDAQKSRIADLQREYDLTDREYKLASTTYYADAGNRLRDQKDFSDKEKSYRDKLATLKQQIADEQTKLGDMQEQAHKAGANKAYD